MSYRLGVDVGGTFTDLLLIDEQSGATFTAKVPSTPEDSSIGVLNGIARICDTHNINAGNISRVMHGTTVATNAVLTGRGARVGLVTTRGFRQVLQVARSFCPGGLGGWVSYVKKPLLAPLELTVEADERIDARGSIIRELDEETLRRDLQRLRARGEVESLTICFINAYINDENERRAEAVAGEVFTDIPISISSKVVPEMQEYERTETTVVNAYVRPEVSKYITNLQVALAEQMGSDVVLSILRSDGGLASGRASAQSPVNMLMSGTGRGSDRRPVFLQPGRLRQHPDVRYGRDVNGCGPDPERQGQGEAGNHRWRRARQGAVGGRAYRGRRRGLHCFCSGADPRAARRSAIRGSRSRSGGIHERWRGTYGV